MGQQYKPSDRILADLSRIAFLSGSYPGSRKQKVHRLGSGSVSGLGGQMAMNALAKALRIGGRNPYPISFIFIIPKKGCSMNLKFISTVIKHKQVTHFHIIIEDFFFP